MGAFSPSALSPAVVLAYHRTRDTWERLAYDDRLASDGLFGGREYADYIHADADMAEAIRGHGGEWAIGSLVYRLSPKGIEIHRVFPDDGAPPL